MVASSRGGKREGSADCECAEWNEVEEDVEERRDHEGGFGFASGG